MKTSLALGTILTVLLVSAAASAATQTYKATLNQAQEVPPTGVAATGTATITFNDATKHITGTVTFTGLDTADVNGTGHHIHKGACGAPGGLALTLPDAVAGTITIPDTDFTAHAADLVAGNLYVNLHTAADPNGAIRGQLYLDGSTTTCPAPGTDAGTSTSSSSSSSSSSSGGSSGASGGSSGASGGSSGATTERPDGGSSGNGGGSSSSSGCATAAGSGSGTSGTTLAFTLVAGAALLAATRKRRDTR